MKHETITPGHAAYIEDCARKPKYDTGELRRSWEILDDLTRWSWEREPTPRDWSSFPKEEIGISEQSAWYDTSAELA